MKNFIQIDWLEKHLDDESILIIDCRSDLLKPELGIRAYEDAHIKNAVFLDLNEELASEETKHGGRHPLPKLEDFKASLERRGIDHTTTIVAYDDLKIAGAARLCWMLRMLGHKNNGVLDGGIDKWIKEDRPLESGPSTSKREKSKFSMELDKSILADVQMVRDSIGNPKSILVDSRAEKRYLGIIEPIDRLPGHIEGAINLHWKMFLKDDGSVHQEKVQEKYAHLKDYEEVIVYCGSGIDANFNFLLLDDLGIKSKVYPGSWSDWISYPENEKYIVVKK